MIKLFELTTALFEQPGKWNQISTADKKKHFFMTSRFMAITKPLQALVLNHVKINMPAALDFWQGFMRQSYTKTPFWMFMPGAKKKKEKKEKIAKVSTESIILYAKANYVEVKDINDLIRFYPDKTIKDIKQFEKIKK
jgi:hypothetical protein